MFNVRVEYESTPIRHIAVQCPKCKKWFCGWDIVNGNPLQELRCKHDIDFAIFTCPVCKTEFGGRWLNRDEPNIEEVDSSDECYKDCLKRKETWG